MHQGTAEEGGGYLTYRDHLLNRQHATARRLGAGSLADEGSLASARTAAVSPPLGSVQLALVLRLSAGMSCFLYMFSGRSCEVWPGGKTEISRNPRRTDLGIQLGGDLPKAGC